MIPKYAGGHIYWCISQGSSEKQNQEEIKYKQSCYMEISHTVREAEKS